MMNTMEYFKMHRTKGTVILKYKLCILFDSTLLNMTVLITDLNANGAISCGGLPHYLQKLHFPKDWTCFSQIEF